MTKDEVVQNSSFSENPVRPCRRKLVDWINPTGVKKVHSSIDKAFNLVWLIPSLASRKS
jgi:hypothetical protein